MHVPRSAVAPSKVVAAFANDRAKMHTAARAHPDPTALCIGFSGRSSKKSDPTVVGQVADMSMRSVVCPIVADGSEAASAGTSSGFIEMSPSISHT